MRIAPFEPKWLDGVAELDRASFALPWSKTAFADELRNPLARYHVLLDDDACVAGYGGYWHVADEAQVTNIAVAPQWRGRGYGSCLLVHLMDQARQAGARLMTLEVRVGNLAAQALYQKHGFAIVGRRKGYYSDNGEDALIMTKEWWNHAE